MNRTDRLLAIILELQSKTVCRAEELAATFEISTRTVYRDMEALAEAGVPIVATPGRGYTLVEGYFLPPVRFTVEEATTLLLGMTLMAQTFDLDYQRASTTAAYKIDALLNAADRARIAELRARIQFIAMPGTDRTDEQAAIPKLRRAMLESRLVRFAYTARYGGKQPDTPPPETRDVEPYHLVNVGGNWQLIGYCLVRQAIRVFRLSRMANVQILSRSFDRNVHLDLFEQTGQAMARPHYPFTATLYFDSEVAPWIMEDPFFYIVERLTDTHGVRVLLSAPDAQAVLQWILGWGRHVISIEPEALRQQVIDELRTALVQLTKG